MSPGATLAGVAWVSGVERAVVFMRQKSCHERRVMALGQIVQSLIRVNHDRLRTAAQRAFSRPLAYPHEFAYFYLVEARPTGWDRCPAGLLDRPDRLRLGGHEAAWRHCRPTGPAGCHLDAADAADHRAGDRAHALLRLALPPVE